MIKGDKGKGILERPINSYLAKRKNHQRMQKKSEKLDVYVDTPDVMTHEDYTFSIFYLLLTTTILSQAMRYYKLSISAYQRD